MRSHWAAIADYARIAVSGTPQWAKTLSRKMFNVPHRHALMTLPDKLRTVLSDQPEEGFAKDEGERDAY